jgi:hypothetical protein
MRRASHDITSRLDPRIRRESFWHRGHSEPPGGALVFRHSHCADDDTWTRAGFARGNRTATYSTEPGRVACDHVPYAFTQGGVLHLRLSEHRMEGGALHNPAAAALSAGEGTTAPNRGERHRLNSERRDRDNIYGSRSFDNIGSMTSETDSASSNANTVSPTPAQLEHLHNGDFLGACLRSTAS